jgi:anti-sigma regulatory factor (Ser/Thr protein kinase)
MTYQVTGSGVRKPGVRRQYIDRACREAGITEDLSFELQLCMDEACTNIIEHGYAGMNPGSIILEMEITDESVTMFITDFGHAFEPGNVPKPDITASLKDRLEKGFGLFLIYSIMDSG